MQNLESVQFWPTLVSVNSHGASIIVLLIISTAQTKLADEMQ